MKMMNKLRTKVITMSLISIFFILAIIVVVINVYNFSMVAVSADETLYHIKDNGGKLENTSPDKEVPGVKEAFDGGKPGEKKQYDADYFTYSFDDDGNISKIAFSMIDISENDAKEMASELVNSSKGWAHLYYRYLTYEYSNSTYVTVSNQRRELEPSYRVLWTSIIGIGIGMAFSLLAFIPISKWMVKPVESAINKQKRFISDASHELKTPLAIISLNNDLEIAEKGESENTSNISTQIASLTDLASSLNALAKLDEEEKIVFSPINLSSLANDVSSSFENVFKALNKTFVTDIKDGLMTRGNQELIKRLLTIILDNATKYSTSIVKFTVKTEGKNIVIEERNDSANIQEGDLSSVFARFYRLQEHRSSNISGSGLGLAMAKDIVKKHNGEISARGENGYFIVKVTL